MIAQSQEQVEQWAMYEVELAGPSEGNPFVGTALSAVFTHAETGKTYEPEGFYDGNGAYKIRFMPDEQGQWTYHTKSNRDTLAGKKGTLTCLPPSEGNHGPVGVRDRYHFEYADGTNYFPFGTTIYEWAFQDKKDQTIETLKNSPFNKVRMLAVPPAGGEYENGGSDELEHFPFEGSPETHWNFARFNPTFFQQLEEQIMRLQDIGMQVDLILFRPYDYGRWGFDEMDPETNARFTRYMVARFAAFKNIWWSLANENSFMESITDEEWSSLFKLVKEKDPYNHLRSIHNADRLYDYNKPWVTHASLQYYNAVRAPGVPAMLRDIYRKPIVLDEIHYEGNISSRWGQLSGEEMTYRFWTAYSGGAYATHGEAVNDGWIANGGKLTMESPERIAFLKQILEDGPEQGLEPIDHWYWRNLAGKEGDYYLYYLGKRTPDNWKFELPEDGLEEGDQFRVDVIDTWNMTITPTEKVYEVERKDGYRFVDIDGKEVELPGKPYIAIRIQRVAE
ncbi:DUF5060 domain-containing protein [Aliifodinibius sp. S!AR15-10]|uniref:DUF5060 domain-containing protein n=1 Tax=Aliifodinibius sp. S!AR15-10 TaxID=2950437 RepID=UPI00285E65A1|nr:DUF5060 domain-containing protein [Aliifodinibius sp. S!AR15-10]MDR8391917.1 DUF5060 domain-containing protein [Aliifodinibius sp. S!AR15-10]